MDEKKGRLTIIFLNFVGVEWNETDLGYELRNNIYLVSRKKDMGVVTDRLLTDHMKGKVRSLYKLSTNMKVAYTYVEKMAKKIITLILFTLENATKVRNPHLKIHWKNWEGIKNRHKIILRDLSY